MAEVAAGGRLRTRAQVIDAAPRRVAPARPLLWGAEDLLRWVITAGLGGIVVVVAWYVAAGQATFSQQVAPLDAAIAGLLLSGIGNLAWLLHGRRALGERRRLLLPDVAPATTIDAPAVPVEAESELLAAATPPAGTVLAGDVFLAGAGMERYHRPGCALAAGRTGWTTATRQEHEAAGRRACGVCRP
ncbi:MAG TPA: hypothetical protein VIY26_01910 [Acidimicrobiales bacterium]